jgi:hypothetical protein
VPSNPGEISFDIAKWIRVYRFCGMRFLDIVLFVSPKTDRRTNPATNRTGPTIYTLEDTILSGAKSKDSRVGFADYGTSGASCKGFLEGFLLEISTVGLIDF